MKNVNTQRMINLEHIETFHINDDTRQRIRESIKLNNTNYEKIANKSNGSISRIFIAKLMSGDRSGISKKKLMVLCEILGLDIESLLSGSARYFN